MTALAACLLLAACASVKPQPPCKPIIVHDVVKQTVAVPAELTAPCLLAIRKSNRVADVVDALNRDQDSITDCNKRMTLIRSLPASASSTGQ